MNGMMELTESMFRYLAEKVCGRAQSHTTEQSKSIWQNRLRELQ